jgi:hypothetical protein
VGLALSPESSAIKQVAHRRCRLSCRMIAGYWVGASGNTTAELWCRTLEAAVAVCGRNWSLVFTPAWYSANTECMIGERWGKCPLELWAPGLEMVRTQHPYECSDAFRPRSCDAVIIRHMFTFCWDWAMLIFEHNPLALL